ncbi:MAG: LysR family transcriptional regulator [Mogibacterium sp.]|nr:LysR family transcriptional regulator [Mogibacterium sp.]
MTLLQLQYFTANCEYGSMSKAAEELYVSQPAISSSIKRLEESLGMPLFERDSRFQLNAAGRYLYRNIDILLQKIDEIKEHMIQHSNITGTVRIMLGVKYFAIADCLTAIWKAHPGISVYCMDYTQNLDAELIITRTEDEKIALPDSYESRILAAEMPLSLAVYRDHSLAERSSVTASELTGERMLFESNSTFHLDRSYQDCLACGVIPDISVIVTDIEQKIYLVCQKAGICLIPGECASHYAHNPGLVLLPVEGLSTSSQNLQISWNAGTELTTQGRLLLDFITDYYAGRA